MQIITTIKHFELLSWICRGRKHRGRQIKGKKYRKLSSCFSKEDILDLVI